MSSDQADLGAQLCVGCGMCCDGTMYVHATVKSGEEQRMVAAGLEVFEKDGKTLFRHPCPHSKEGRCAIYETRFHICHTFECALLRQAQKSELSLAEAKEKIGIAKDLLGRAIATDASARILSGRIELRARLADEMEKSSGADRIAISQRLLKVIALDEYLDRWFRNKKKVTDEDQEGETAEATVDQS